MTRFTARLEPIESGTFVVIPAEVVEALAAEPAAKAAFEGLAPSHRREYADHVARAKRPETRHRRAIDAVDHLRG